LAIRNSQSSTEGGFQPVSTITFPTRKRGWRFVIVTVYERIIAIFSPYSDKRR
jgi:hypothetical protein